MSRTATTIEQKRPPETEPTRQPTRTRRRPSLTADQLTAFGIVALATAYVVWLAHPELIFADTTPVQGDLGAHVHEPAFLRDKLLPNGRLSGWSQDWFTGYPSLTFYFPLGSLLVVLADLLLPYNVALLLVVAAGPTSLPVCAYAFGRLSGRDRLASAFLAVATLPLLLEPTLIISGGSLAAAAVGEYGYGLSLSLGLVVLGLARNGMETGRWRALTACLLAATVLLHLLPALLVLAGIVVSVIVRPRHLRARARWAAPVFVVAGALTGFWAVPFLLWGKVTAGPEYDRVAASLEVLFPAGMAPLVTVAFLGLVLAAFAALTGERRWDEHDTFLVVMAVISGLVFALAPSGRVWNMRFLPVWMLLLCLVAGTVLAEVARGLDDLRRHRAREDGLVAPALVRLLLPCAFLAAMLPLWDSRFGRGMLTKEGFSSELAARLSFEGYERAPFRAEYEAFFAALRDLAREHGCGRAHWEWSTEIWNDHREPILQLVPYVTDGCIGVTQGLFVQSSATAPFVNLANSRLSSTPEVLDVGRPLDFAAGVEDLRMLGVRWLISSGTETQALADASPDLRLVVETEPYDGRFWKIYEVSGSKVVELLRHAPVVVPGIDRTRRRWEAAVVQWYDSGRGRDVRVAAAGPGHWPRADGISADLPRRSVPQASVGRVRIDDDRISFDVSRTGTPVLVKVSYFPNWRVSGASGPWRVTPNQMVVVPTSRTVTLRYERTAVDHAGWALTLAGVGGLAALARRGPVAMPVTVEAPVQEQRPARRNPPKKRRR